jgi:hypothetical protein
MSVLDTLKSFEHTFTGWVAKAYAAFHKAEPTIVAVSDKALPYIKAATSIAVGFEFGGAAAEAAVKIEDEIHNSADVLMGVIYDFGATPKALDILNGIKASLGSLLALGHIKSASATDAVTKAVNSADALAQLISDGIAAIKPAA